MFITSNTKSRLVICDHYYPIKKLFKVQVIFQLRAVTY